MTSFPGSPRLVKGAIVGIDPLNPLASVIVFQYNPDTMTRRLAGADARRRRGRPRRGAAAQGRADRDHLARRRDRRHRPARDGRTRVATQPGDLSAALGARDADLSEERAGDRQHGAAGAGHDRDHAAGGAVHAVHLGAEAGAAGAHQRASPSPRRPTTSTSIRSAPRSRSACACSSYNDLPVLHPGYYALPRPPGGQGDDGRRRQPATRRLGSRRSSFDVKHGRVIHVRPNSRYYNLRDRGAHDRRRARSSPTSGAASCPRGEPMPLLVEVTVVAGRPARPDHGAHALGDPEQFWRVCDANDAMDPIDLTNEPGSALRVRLPQAEGVAAMPGPSRSRKGEPR